jgi:murein DD-endopeptidase MepM/ murein hydrolase activator NlpD
MRSIIAVFVLGFLFLPFIPTAWAVENLEKQIEEKSKVLEQIELQKQVLEKGLEQISTQGTTLKTELKKIDTNLSQLELSTKQSGVKIEQLGLELTNLNEELYRARQSVNLKREAIKDLMREMQKRGEDDVLQIVLKNKTLSQNVAELQEIKTLSAKLSDGIYELESLQKEIKDRQNDVVSVKKNKEVEYITLSARKSIIAEEKQEKQKILTQTKQQEKIFQEQLSVLEQLQSDIAEEVERAEFLLQQGIDESLLPTLKMAWPIPGARMTQDYGETAFAKRAYKGHFHNGIDFGSPIGTPVLASESGRIISAADQDKFCRKGAYGKYVMIKHPNGLTTLYGHLSKYIVKEGEKVERGQVIGYVGKTGYATGPHLHFTVLATQTIPKASPGYDEGTQASRSCGPMPIGGPLNPLKYL